MSASRPRTGAVLLEAIVAITIVGMLGLAAIASTAEALRTGDVVRGAELQMRGASSLMTAASLWSRQDLELRLGLREQGPWVMEIHRVGPTLFDIVLWDGSGRLRILETTVYRAP